MLELSSSDAGGSPNFAPLRLAYLLDMLIEDFVIAAQHVQG